MTQRSSHSSPDKPRRHSVNNTPVFEIMDLFYALFRWRWFIIFFTLISAIVSFIATSARDLEYQAVATVIINPLGINIVEGDINERTESPDVNFALLESQMRIMASRQVLQDTIINLKDENWKKRQGRPLDLLNDPEFNAGKGGLRGILSSLIGGGAKSNEDRMMNVISAMRKKIAVFRPQLEYVVDLNFKSSDPDKAAIIANAIAETYLEKQGNSNADQAKQAAEDLNKQLKKLRSELNKAEQLVEDHKRKNKIITAPGGLANELEFAQVQQDLIQARNKANDAKLAMDTVNTLRASGAVPQNLPVAITSRSIETLRAQLAQAKQRQTSLSAQYLPTHPIMRSANLAVQDAENSVRSELALIAQAAQLEYNNNLKAVNELEKKVSNLTKLSFKTNNDLIELRDLQRDVDAKKVVFEASLKRVSELGQQADVNTSNSNIVDFASPPSSPTNLPGSILMAGGTIFGFCLACAMVLIGTGVSTLSRTMSNYGQNQNNAKPGRETKKRQSRSTQIKKGKKQSLIKNIFQPQGDDTEEYQDVSHAKSSKTGTANTSAKSGKKHIEGPINLPVLHTLEIDRGYMLGEQIPQLEESEPGERIADLVDQILSLSSGANTRIVLITGIEDSYSKSVLAANFSYAASYLGHDCALINMDSENRAELASFANEANLGLNAAEERQVVNGASIATGQENLFQFFSVRNMDRDNPFQANVELMKLKEHLEYKTKRYDIAFINGPLLDQTNQLEKVAEIVDEVIVTMPKKSTGSVKASIFSRLGSRAKRIRGLVTTLYYAT